TYPRRSLAECAEDDVRDLATRQIGLVDDVYDLESGRGAAPGEQCGVDEIVHVDEALHVVARADAHEAPAVDLPDQRVHVREVSRPKDDRRPDHEHPASWR